MAIIRSPLKCSSCGAKIITRTAPGISDTEHRFPCPSCGVEIRFALVRNKKSKIGYSFRVPVNAKWIKSEAGAIATLSFDPDRLAPKDMTNVFSPFLAEAPKLTIEARKAWAAEEARRRAWRDSHWPWIQRLIVHFDNRNLSLFDKEAKLAADSPHAATWASRLRLLYQLLEKALDDFTLNRTRQTSRVRQRIALAQAGPKDLYDQMVKIYLASDRTLKLWQELIEIRTTFLFHYLCLSPLLRTLYWSKPPKDLSAFVLPEKRFDELRQLYVDCFETLCRVIVIVIGVEAIIHHRALEIPTKKGTMTLWDFEAMSNGIKHTVIEKYPIHDLFVPSIDHKLRNGIGHHSAFYSSTADEVAFYKHEGTTLDEVRMSYTEFAGKVLKLYSALELAALYFHPVHVRSCELESP